MAVKKKASKARKATSKKTTAKKKPAASKAKTTTRKKTTAARKTTARKSTVRKVASKKKAPAKKKTATRAKPTARKTTAKKTAAKVAAAPKFKDALTKTQLMTTIAEMTEVPKKDVSNVFEALGKVIEASLKKGGPRSFTLPGVAKLQVTRKKARKARKGVNPFTGEEMMFKAKPAKDVVKARLLKKIKEIVE